MKKSMSFKLCTAFVAAALLLSSSAFALDEDVSEEVSEEVRLVAAREKLSSESGTAVMYAKGLCCPTCAIGVRKKISSDSEPL